MVVALFDCDGTLYAAQFGRGLLEYAASRGFGGRVRSYYAALLPRYLLRKARLIDEQALNRPAIANLGRLIAGWDQQAGAAAFAWVADQYLMPTKRAEVLARLSSHISAGLRVVLLSGVFEPCLGHIAAQLGVTDLIGTRLEVMDGRYTGNIIPPVITGRDKLPTAIDFFASRDLQVDWGASYAYADSSHDSSILEAVGNPVAVYPDAELLALAQARKWPVIQ